jgi:peptidoglycan/xylan/chitin deacetylase (PgdA/CDA1 family)
VRLQRPDNPLVLCYHGVGEVDDDIDPNRLVVSPKNLAGQIRWLKRRGREFVTASALAADPAPSRPTAALTFDDGWRDGVTTVLPMLLELGIPATFYVCPGLWGTQHKDVTGDAGRLMTADEAAALHEAGMELGSHSMTHPDLRRLSDDELHREVETSRSEIAALTGTPCRTFAYPFGLFAEREVRAVGRAGYELAFAWLPGPWRRLAAPRLPAPPRHGALRLALKTIGVRRHVELA